MNEVINGRYSISIDLGTGSCKVCALDERGMIAASAGKVYTTHSPHQGWAEQDPGDWLKAVSGAVSELGAKIELGEVALITLTGAAHIAVLLDGSDRPVRRALLWSDQRSRSEAERLRSECGNFILSHSLNNVTTSWTLPHLVWVREQESEVWKAMRRICLSKDFILLALTGERKTDPATAMSAMLYDAANGCWSERLCALAGIDLSILPEVVPADHIAGTVTALAAKEFGLPEGIPVFNGTLDSATETYGAGATCRGDIVIRVGTAGGIHLIKDSPSPDAQLLTYPFPKGGLWYSQAGTNAAGSAISWAVTAAGGTRIAADYEAFSRMASTVPAGADGLLFHPFLAGERTPYWDPELRGTFTGASLRHGKEHFARSVLEGVAFSLCDASLAICDRSSLPACIRVVGGGGADPLLMEILSTTLDRELLVLGGIDSAFGAALFGQRCSGRATVPIEKQPIRTDCIKPKLEDSDAYAEAFGRYRRGCTHLQELYRDGITL